MLADRVSNLIAQKNFQGAEELLLEKRKKASAANDAQLMGVVLSELIELYSLLDPPLWSKAEALSIERERLAPSAYSRLQTAMILHHGARDYKRCRTTSQVSPRLATPNGLHLGMNNSAIVGKFGSPHQIENGTYLYHWLVITQKSHNPQTPTRISFLPSKPLPIGI